MRGIAFGFRFNCEECNGFGPLEFVKKMTFGGFSVKFLQPVASEESNI